MQDLHLDPDDKAIVQSIISMARAMGLQVTAEGVELEEQLTLLQGWGCDLIQGYYFGRPLPALEFEGLLHAERSVP